jgi:hypothetical protein
MSEIRFRLNMSSQTFLAYYRGTASEVEARAVDGRTVRFPANILRPFVTHDGVAGLFALVYDEQNKFVEMKRVGP